MERYFAPCPRGLEAPLAAELAALGAGAVTPADGGVAFAGDVEVAYRANLESRLASRVLWQVGFARYGDERDVHEAVRAVEWPRLFEARRTLRVDVAATRSPLQSLAYVTLSVKDAVCDRFRADTGVRPSVDKRAPDVRVHVHLTATEATIYLDTSGEPLFKRGWRRETDEAPLRENLAAGLLALAGWTPRVPLLDPMCGSGTIAVEAAMIAADRAPGLSRTFGFQKLAWYDGPTWQRIRQRAQDRVREAPAQPAIFASDLAAGAVAKCRANLAHAKVERFVQADVADALERSAPAPHGVIVTNPPYGVRLADRARMEAFYPRLGDALKRRFAGWTAWIFTGDLTFPRHVRLAVSRRVPLYNGAIECRLFAIPLREGSNRARGPGNPGPVLESNG